MDALITREHGRRFGRLQECWAKGMEWVKNFKDVRIAQPYYSLSFWGGPVK